MNHQSQFLKKLAVITGCDSGIGKSLCEILARNGYCVLASYLEQASFAQNLNVIPVQMDLRHQESITKFASQVQEHCRKGYALACLVNNAGIAMGGPVEDTPLDVFREVFEVNFFGLVSLTQKLIPLLIDSKGMLVLIGSMAGKIALPFLAPYASSKFALEGFADSIRRELFPFGISTVLIEPASVATPIWNKAKRQDVSMVQGKYQKSLGKFLTDFIDAGNQGMASEKAAQRIFKILKMKNPSPRYIIASKVWLSYLEQAMPSKLFDKIALKLFSMDYGKEKSVKK